MDDTNDAICFNKMFFKGLRPLFFTEQEQSGGGNRRMDYVVFLVNVYSYCSFVYSIVFIKDDLDVSRGDY